jgi:hypothetical protein
MFTHSISGAPFLPLRESWVQPIAPSHSLWEPQFLPKFILLWAEGPVYSGRF